MREAGNFYLFIYGGLILFFAFFGLRLKDWLWIAVILAITFVFVMAVFFGVMWIRSLM